MLRPLMLDPRARRLAGLPPLSGGEFGGAGASYEDPEAWASAAQPPPIPSFTSEDLGAAPPVPSMPLPQLAPEPAPAIQAAAARFTNADLPPAPAPPPPSFSPPPSTFAEADPLAGGDVGFRPAPEDLGALTLPEDFRLPRGPVDARSRATLQRVFDVPDAPRPPITDEVVDPGGYTLPNPLFIGSSPIGA